MRSGWKTTEFWTMLGMQIISLLAILGVINAGDQAQLEDAFSKCVAGVALVLSNAWIIVTYIRGRTSLKDRALKQNGNGNGNNSHPA